MLIDILKQLVSWYVLCFESLHLALLDDAVDICGSNSLPGSGNKVHTGHLTPS